MNDSQQDKNKYESLVESRREREQHYEEFIRTLKDQQELEKQ